MAQPTNGFQAVVFSFVLALSGCGKELARLDLRDEDNVATSVTLMKGDTLEPWTSLDVEHAALCANVSETAALLGIRLGGEAGCSFGMASRRSGRASIRRRWRGSSRPRRMRWQDGHGLRRRRHRAHLRRSIAALAPRPGLDGRGRDGDGHRGWFRAVTARTSLGPISAFVHGGVLFSGHGAHIGAAPPRVGDAQVAPLTQLDTPSSTWVCWPAPAGTADGRTLAVWPKVIAEVVAQGHPSGCCWR
jgi:hypothetical protein